MVLRFPAAKPGWRERSCARAARPIRRLRWLAREGVDTSSCERVGDQNVTVSLSFDGDRAMTTRGTTALPRLGGDAPSCLLADVRGISANSEVVSSWRERGTWVLADTAWDEAGAWDPADLEALRVADVCTPNEEEALAYARTESVEEAARWFASFGCDCVVTCGKNGVVACVDGRGGCFFGGPGLGAPSAPYAVARGARPRLCGRRPLHAGDRRILVSSLRGRPPGRVSCPTGAGASSRAQIPLR